MVESFEISTMAEVEANSIPLPISNPTSPLINDINNINSPPIIINHTSNNNSISSPITLSKPLIIEDEIISNHVEQYAQEDVEEEEESEGNLIERIKELELELVTTKNEKETFEIQYRSLLGKLTSMRNTLGDKLKQDAVSSILSLEYLSCYYKISLQKQTTNIILVLSLPTYFLLPGLP